MIKNITIIKDGLPLFNKQLISGNFGHPKDFFFKKNNLVLASGFISALNSFSDSFNEIGSIKEIKFSNDLTLSFIKDGSIPNLIYLCSFDNNSNSVNVQRFLRRISKTFLQKYNTKEIINWSGRIDHFKEFRETIEEYIEDEEDESESQSKENVVDFFKEVEDKINDNEPQSQKDNNTELENEKNGETDNKFSYNRRVPLLKISEKVNPKYYLSGELSFKVFKQIDGKRSIAKIARDLKISDDRVYNTCKNLVKMGFISLS